MNTKEDLIHFILLKIESVLSSAEKSAQISRETNSLYPFFHAVEELGKFWAYLDVLKFVDAKSHSEILDSTRKRAWVILDGFDSAKFEVIEKEYQNVKEVS